MFAGTVTIINSTLADNTAAGGVAYGGGVWAGQDSLVTITGSTIAGNRFAAGTPRGAAFFQITGGSGSVEVQDSVVANPISGTNCAAGGRLPDFLGKNLIDDTSCGAASASRTIGDALLGPLADNTGPTDTRVPAPGSPALDAASSCVTPADQRGSARPVGPACDLGAVEVGADLQAGVSVSNPNPSAGSDIVVTASVLNKGSDRSTGTTMTVVATGASQLLSASGPCTLAGLTATCSFGAVDAGATATALLTVRMPSSGPVSFSAAANSAQADPNPANNTASASAEVPVGPQPQPQPQPVPGACSVVRNGTAKADVLTGTGVGDRIAGKGGNDRIDGQAGQDCLSGGKGNDRLTAGADADRVSGGAGRDRVNVRDGAKDQVSCGPGRDRVIADRKDVLSKCEVVRRK